MAMETSVSPRILKAAMKNTHINNQKTIVPKMVGTFRSMPMCRIDWANPLRSAATCKPSFSLTLTSTLLTNRATR